MAQIYRTCDRMDEAVRAQVLADAEGVLGRVEGGGRWCILDSDALLNVGRASARHPEGKAG